MKTRYSLALSLLIGMLFSFNLYAQDAVPAEKKSKPVRKPFNANQLVDLQTVVQPKAKSLELIIHHRFGTMENGISDLFGIYAPSNIRLGLNYGITERLMIGVGTEKDRKLQDVQLKYAILQQTKSGSIPVSLSYYGNMAIDARNESVFGDQELTLSTRMSYFNQLLVSRKFSNDLSFVLGTGYSHINRVDSTKQNDVFTLSLGGKYSVTRKITLIAEYTHPFFVKAKEPQQILPEPNLGFGFEVGTSTHVFQITCSQYRSIVPQYNAVYNANSLSNGGLVLGFNINVKF